MHCVRVNTNTIIVFKYISGYLILITHTISVLVNNVFLPFRALIF